MKRLLAALLLTCAYTGHSYASQSVWDGAALPESLRATIHLTSADLPPFPNEDPSLLDPQQWPDSVALLGKWFYIWGTATRSDEEVAFGRKRLIRPGWALYLGYQSLKKFVDPAAYPGGPAFSWNEKGRLWRRTWYTPDTVTYRSVSYITRPSGALLSYGVAERRPRASSRLMQFTEYFGQDRALLGFSYKMTGQSGRYWWKGQSVSPSEWDEKERQAWREANEER